MSVYCLYCKIRARNLKELNETLEFPFWGVNICVDFNLRGSKTGKYEETK